MFDGQNFSENSFDEVPVVCKYESHDESAVDIQESDQGREERDGGFDQVSLLYMPEPRFEPLTLMGTDEKSYLYVMEHTLLRYVKAMKKTLTL